MKEAAADLVLLEHDGDRFVLVERCPAGAAAFGVGRGAAGPRAELSPRIG